MEKIWQMARTQHYTHSLIMLYYMILGSPRLKGAIENRREATGARGHQSAKLATAALMIRKVKMFPSVKIEVYTYKSNLS